MKSTTRLSVIVPGYNTPENEWSRCLKSVLKACSQFDEVICVDDGSTIDTGWLDGFCKSDNRLSLVRLVSNSGQSVARNTALEIARGGFVTFVDSDDEVLSETYDRCFESIDRYGCDITLYGVRVVWVNDGLAKDNVLEDGYYGELSPERLLQLYKACLLEYPCNKIYKASFLKAHGIRFEPKVCPGEDTAFNVSCLIAKATWCSVAFAGYVYYRADGTSLSRYFPNIRYSLQFRTDLWRKYKACTPRANEVLGLRFEYSDKDIDTNEMLNMWRRGSPVPLGERLGFMRQHPRSCRWSPFLDCIYMFVFRFVRLHFYVRPLRRWHIRRLYPDVKDVKAGFV